MKYKCNPVFLGAILLPGAGCLAVGISNIILGRGQHGSDNILLVIIGIIAIIFLVPFFFTNCIETKEDKITQSVLILFFKKKTEIPYNKINRIGRKFIPFQYYYTIEAYVNGKILLLSLIGYNQHKILREVIPRVNKGSVVDADVLNAIKM